MKLTTIKTIFLSLLLISSFIATPTYADNKSSICDDDAIPQEVKNASGCDNNSDDELPTVITSIISSVILFSGTISVIFIIVGGVQYMTSTGDPAKIKKAKDTILYACIGLLVCALSYAVVNFVILQLLKQGSSNNNPNNNTNNNNSNNKNTSVIIQKTDKEVSYIEQFTKNDIAFFK